MNKKKKKTKEEERFRCTWCSKGFRLYSSLTKHERTHTGERPFKCKECDKQFAAKETLNRHVRTHTDNKPHVCKICGKGFIQLTQLRAHMFYHTGQYAYKCKKCGEQFNRPSRLKVHIKFVHQNATRLECDVCKKTFLEYHDLKRHMAIHSGVKEFQCDTCKKSFLWKSALDIHALTHRKEVPRACYECNRAFVRLDTYIRHIRRMHKNKLNKVIASVEIEKLRKCITNIQSSSTIDTAEDGSSDELFIKNLSQLLLLLVDRQHLQSFGWPSSPIDEVLDAVVIHCNGKPVLDMNMDYIERLRQNTESLLTSVIKEHSLPTLFNNKTVDEIVSHIVKSATMTEKNDVMVDL